VVGPQVFAFLLSAEEKQFYFTSKIMLVLELLSRFEKGPFETGFPLSISNLF
jgi:hypothetical protein